MATIPPIELEDALLPGGGLAMEADKLRVEQALLDDVAASVPAGAAGGDLGGEYPNPTVDALNTTGTSVNVALAAPPVAGQVLTATDATHATWKAAAGGGESELWYPPAVAHARDVEFNGPLPGDFVWADAAMAPIAPTQTDQLTTRSAPASVPRYSVHTRRRSWLQWQTLADGLMRYVYAPWAAPTDATAICRARFVTPMAVLNGVDSKLNEYGIRWCLFANNAGKPDIQNYVYLESHAEPPGQVSKMSRYGVVLSGVDTIFRNNTYPHGANFGMTPTLHYFAHRKEGTSFNGYMGGDHGWISMNNAAGNDSGSSASAAAANPTLTFSLPVAFVGIRFVCGNVMPAVYPIFEADFWRFTNSPWGLP